MKRGHIDLATGIYVKGGHFVDLVAKDIRKEKQLENLNKMKENFKANGNLENFSEFRFNSF